MSRRTIYLCLGAVAGLLAVLRATAAAQGPTSEGVQQPGSGSSLSAWWAEVQAAAAEREQELRTLLGLDGTHDLVDADLPGDRL